jgi:hypothetical protein
VREDALDDKRLRLDKFEHLRPFVRDAIARNASRGRTSAGFLPRNTALILAKWEAMTIWVFISSGDMSSIVSQKGANSWLEWLTHVSTMDHISLQSTSVATYGYLAHLV